MKFNYIICMFLFLSGCQTERDNATAKQPAQRFNEISKGIVYFKDHRSGLCFAYIYESKGRLEYATGSPSITLVPEDKVKHLLINP